VRAETEVARGPEVGSYLRGDPLSRKKPGQDGCWRHDAFAGEGRPAV